LFSQLLRKQLSSAQKTLYWTQALENRISCEMLTPHADDAGIL